MANESQFIPDGGKSHSHQKYVVAQGNVVLRVLPREAHAQIRHCEIALVENNGRPQDYRYFVVTSDTLFVVERTGSPPRVQTIQFSAIEEIEQENGGADYLADVNIQACSRRTRIAYGKESTDMQSSPQNLSPETQRRRSSFFASTRSNSSKDLGPREGRQELDSPVGRSPPSLENLALVTLEKQSKLYFHLWHAWIGFHMRQVALQQAEAELAPAPLSPRHVLGKPSRTLQEGQASTRGLFRELQECILAKASRWDDGPMLALEELAVAAETSALMKRLFFESDVLFRFLAGSFRLWLAQATKRIDIAPPPPSPKLSHSSSFRQTTAKPSTRPRASTDPSQLREDDVMLTSQQDRRRISGPLPRDDVTRGANRRRVERASVERSYEPDPAVVLRWEWLLRRLGQARAGGNVLRIVDCVQRVLSNSEGIPSRLNLMNVASPHSLDTFLVDVFLLERLDPSTAPIASHGSPKQQAVTRGALQEAAAVDLAAALLFEADSLGQHAFLAGAAPEPDFVLWALRKAPEPALRKRLSALFRRLIKLLLAPAAALDGLRVFKLAHTVTLLLPGVPGGCAHVGEEFEEEMRYVLQSPDLQLKLQKRGDFFVQRSRRLVANIVERCNTGMRTASPSKGHRRTGSLI
ncbi:hypothetical protein KFL_000500520 [Klebsormidium nitens]|uniref:Uncharacterized protein n=1 Tax=Klebsormidium nitens TaxID=105231 RepID=A0A1Y1HWS4_KLENI|nr:hypothetical protein KFL_000500520 [Klebsormidium nitens]|eukprot:GAQ80298.1 hypothetical protein KFL_000500520 [Klebsormidium nitens]